jgi:hypothetical protein
MAMRRTSVQVPSLGRGHRVVKARKDRGLHSPHGRPHEVLSPLSTLANAIFRLRDTLVRPPIFPHAEAGGAGDLTRAEEGAQADRATDGDHDGVHLKGGKATRGCLEG